MHDKLKESEKEVLIKKYISIGYSKKEAEINLKKTINLIM